MSEVQIGPGDSLSRLLQVHAREFGVKRVWSGDGRTDARVLLMDFANISNVKECLWKGLQELYSMPELKELPESVQAKLMSVILFARACSELDAKTLAPKV